MKDIKVYFYQRSDHRDIQKDTFRNAPKGVKALSHLKEEELLDNLQILTEMKRQRLKNFFVRRMLQFIPLLNLRRMPRVHEEADFVYTWHVIPLGCRKPFILELENAYGMTFYHPFGFKVLKPLIRAILMSKKCHRVVCMSLACKQTLVHELGRELERKIVVLPPFMEDHLPRKERKEARRGSRVTNFLYVGFDLDRKGGRECLEAFSQVKDDSIRLSVAGCTDKEYERRYSKDKRIRFLGRVTRKDLFSKVYPGSDVFLFPSHHESYGVVALEALSFGLGLITTDVYALPELVIPGKNGLLINHPLLKPSRFGKRSFVDVSKIMLSDYCDRHVKGKPPSEKMIEELKKAIVVAKRDRLKWKAESRKLFLKEYSPKVWEKRFRSIFD